MASGREGELRGRPSPGCCSLRLRLWGRRPGLKLHVGCLLQEQHRLCSANRALRTKAAQETCSRKSGGQGSRQAGRQAHQSTARSPPAAAPASRRGQGCRPGQAEGLLRCICSAASLRQHSTAHHGTAQRSATQHSTVQHNRKPAPKSRRAPGHWVRLDSGSRPAPAAGLGRSSPAAPCGNQSKPREISLEISPTSGRFP